MKRAALLRGALGLGVAGLLLWLPRRERHHVGETREVRFVRQIGLAYLQLYVMQAQGLVEKHAAALGHPGLVASYRPIATPTGMNDMLLAGQADIVAAGLPPFLTIWDKTRGSLDVRALAALSCQPLFLNTNQARVQRLTDLGEHDRIAVPAVKVSTQATFLGMLAEKTFGAGQEGKLDPLTVGLSHPEAAAALIAGGSEITLHFSSFPLQVEELRHPPIHRVASSYDATNGPSTTTAVWTTRRFVGENPLTVRAIVAALEEATRFVADHPAEATALYHAVEDQALPRELIESCVRHPEVIWSLSPRGAIAVGGFMARTGRLAQAPAEVKDLFFPGAHVEIGS